MKNAPRLISDQQLSRLSEFVTVWLGLHFPGNRWRDLQRCMVSAARELGIPDVNACVALLLSRQLTREQEEILANHLTIGETYFFRDQKSFDILENRILPGLIAARRGRDQRLRIWSAGCSSGEEPYSLAMLLSRLIPDNREWQITILASDVNTRSLAKAAHGVYSEWSFRNVPQWIRQRYFTRNNDGFFELSHTVRRMVSFAVLNLAEDSFPSLATNTSAMDIIFCRNVLMYFEQKKQLRVIDGFRRSLVDGGWLVVSPCETSAAFSTSFDTVFFSGAAFYRKHVQGDKTRTPPPAVETIFDEAGTGDRGSVKTFESKPTAETILFKEGTGDRGSVKTFVSQPTAETILYEEALELYQQGSYVEAVGKLSRLPLTSETDSAWMPLFEKASALMARSLANQGRIAPALEWVERAISVDKLNAELYYLRATIFQEQGALSPAIASLKQSLYLDQDFVLAHFSLGTLTLQQGKKGEAGRHFEIACSLLEALPADEPVPASDGMTAARLSEIIAATRAGILQP
ncbi:MAG: chemotaxis protein CheR [Desulfuromonadales bacterium]|nr:chemotaxis protein CheR [Desulfuromonadales bacterium]